MPIDSKYELSSTDDIDFNSEPPTSELDNNLAEFELNTGLLEEKRSKHNSKRNFLAQRKIEQLKEERLLRKLEEDYYDDWD